MMWKSSPRISKGHPVSLNLKFKCFTKSFSRKLLIFNYLPLSILEFLLLTCKQPQARESLLRTPLVCLHLKIFREKPEKSEKSKKWKQMQKKTIFDMLRNKLLYHLENLVNFQALKSRREGILQDSHVQNRPSSKPQHQILLWKCEDLFDANLQPEIWNLQKMTDLTKINLVEKLD